MGPPTAAAAGPAFAVEHQRGNRRKFQERVFHQAAPCRLGWTILPSRAMSVPLTISSSQLTASVFSFLSISVSMKA